jgi:inorganic pyrophosphatase/exopolyphosphatase
MNNMESLEYLKLLAKDVKSFAPEHTHIAVFGNKSDIKEKSIPREELDSIVSSFGIKDYKEVSAKVPLLFCDIVVEISKRHHVSNVVVSWLLNE